MNAKIRLREFLKAELNAASPGEIPTEEANRIVFSLWEKSNHSKRLCNEAISEVGGIKPSKRIASFRRESADFLKKLASSSSLSKRVSINSDTPTKENAEQQSSGGGSEERTESIQSVAKLLEDSFLLQTTLGSGEKSPELIAYESLDMLYVSLGNDHIKLLQIINEVSEQNTKREFLNAAKVLLRANKTVSPDGNIFLKLLVGALIIIICLLLSK